ncbi:hypothetical protein GCM10010343_12720 [Streptomyces avidinii]|nr:hypothetical protein GCM10010343_12720 [Streptomyces avidinii]
MTTGGFHAANAVVTGSDSGIGRAVAVRSFAESAIDVGITWHTDARGARDTAEEVRSCGRRRVVTCGRYGTSTRSVPCCAASARLAG